MPERITPANKTTKARVATPSDIRVAKQPTVSSPKKQADGSLLKSNESFLDKVKSFLNSIIASLGIILGISISDNKPFLELHNTLQNQQGEIKARAEYLFTKSQEYIDHVEKSGIKNVPNNLGVPMSEKLQFLSSNSDEQRYQHNLAVNFWASSQLRRFSPGGQPGKTISIDDHDNTWVNKNWDPSDTGLVQSIEQLYWGRKVFEMGQKNLNTQEWINTARAPFPTIIQIVPEGLEKHVTKGLLHGPLQERFGLSLDDQLHALDHSTLIALNSSIIQKPNEPLQISAKLLRQAELLSFLEGPDGPMVNGKTFFETLKELVNNSGVAVFEPKCIPRYIIDTHNRSGEVHLKLYQKITSLKEKIVDNRAKNISEKEAWIQFAKEVKKNVSEGTGYWQEVDAIKNHKKRGSIEDVRKKAYEYIRLNIDYLNLIDENSGSFNPQEFYTKVTEGIPAAFVVHYYDCHGTPVKEVMDGISGIMRSFANTSEVRRKVAELNTRYAPQTGLHNDIKNFVKKGIEKFKEGGVTSYLEWRLLKHFELHYTSEELNKIQKEGGLNLFNSKDGKLQFSEEFKRNAQAAYEKNGLVGYIEFLKTSFSNSNKRLDHLEKIIETFLPEGLPAKNSKAQSKKDFQQRVESLRKKDAQSLRKETFFYPNEMFITNSTIKDSNEYAYNSICNLVLKHSDLDKLGQYYWEIQPNREKYNAVPDFSEVLKNNLQVHAAGDSKSDIGTLASALDRGGSASIVFNLIKDNDIFLEIIKQRKAYAKLFKDKSELFNQCRERFGKENFYALKEIKKGDVTLYKKIIGFDGKGEAIYKNGDFTKEQLIEELSSLYSHKIIHNTSPEAYIRRRAEIFSLLTGENIELNENELASAKRLYELKQTGSTLTQEQEKLVTDYTWAILTLKKGHLIPAEAPKTNLLLTPQTPKKTFIGKSFIKNMPMLFHGLLKYSGLIMGIGGLVRLVSRLTGSFEEGVYKFGYWLSNSLRAISALGGALRGELNVHKYHNIAFGEVINIISSFLPNGLKHMGLGFGNFILFLGRGQQRAQLMQRTNNHTKPEIEKDKRILSYIDPRGFVRKITKVATDLIVDTKEKLIKDGISPLLSELAGSLLSAIVTPIQMIKDVFKDSRLIFQKEERMSEKSGTYYKPVPSAGHLLTLVGALSGISAVVAGTIGRISRISELTEAGFNSIGRWALALANAIPAIGIMANAKEVMANPGGLPKIFRNLRGNDDAYDPKKAGLRQYLSGIGFGLIPWFGLENKYVASLFDMINGLYFTGAAEEEKPNTNMLGRNLLRKRQEFYLPEQKENIIDFSSKAA